MPNDDKTLNVGSAPLPASYTYDNEEPHLTSTNPYYPPGGSSHHTPTVTTAPYIPIPGNGYYNSNSFTFTLLQQVGLVGPGWTPSGWNPGWSKLVPGL